jgi:hypothetical protein
MTLTNMAMTTNSYIRFSFHCSQEGKKKNHIDVAIFDVIGFFVVITGACGTFLNAVNSRTWSSK